MADRIRVLLADDHPVFRKGLRSVLEDAPDIEVVGEAENGALALSRIQACQPDVAILDLDMPDTDGIEVARSIRDLRLPVRCVLLTAHKSEALVDKALDSGLHGYLLKDGAADEIFDCVRTVHSGHPYVSGQLSTVLLKRRDRTSSLVRTTPGMRDLTATERRVLALVAEGKTSRQIAEGLCVSSRTVEHHRSNAAEKLKLRGSNALIAFAVAHRSDLA